MDSGTKGQRFKPQDSKNLMAHLNVELDQKVNNNKKNNSNENSSNSLELAYGRRQQSINLR